MSGMEHLCAEITLLCVHPKKSATVYCCGPWEKYSFSFLDVLNSFDKPVQKATPSLFFIFHWPLRASLCSTALDPHFSVRFSTTQGPFMRRVCSGRPELQRCCKVCKDLLLLTDGGTEADREIDGRVWDKRHPSKQLSCLWMFDSRLADTYTHGCRTWRRLKFFRSLKQYTEVRLRLSSSSIWRSSVLSVEGILGQRGNPHLLLLTYKLIWKHFLVSCVPLDVSHSYPLFHLLSFPCCAADSVLFVFPLREERNSTSTSRRSQVIGGRLCLTLDRRSRLFLFPVCVLS